MSDWTGSLHSVHERQSVFTSGVTVAGAAELAAGADTFLLDVLADFFLREVISCHSGHITGSSTQNGFMDGQNAQVVCEACHQVLRRGEG
jgi:hypothetical protein